MIKSRTQILPVHVEHSRPRPIQPRITLKDCLTLVIGTAIPVAIGIYTAITNERMQQATQRAEDKQQSIADERRTFEMQRAHEIYQQGLYEKFLETMYTFHRDGELNESAEPWAFANARYRTLHREFDAIRKSQALIFLKEKELIGRQKCTTGCELKTVPDIIRLKGLNFDNLNLNSDTDGLSQLDLSCVEFDEISMRNTTFSYANLNGAVFKNSRLSGATFQGSSLNCAQIEKSQLNGTNFSGSILNGTIFKEVDLSTTTLTDKQKNEAHFENITISNNPKLTSTIKSTTDITGTTTAIKSTTKNTETTTTMNITRSKSFRLKIFTNVVFLLEWVLVSNMTNKRIGHTTLVLPDGKVLVIGGPKTSTSSVNIARTAEFYDQSTNKWTATDKLNNERHEHVAVLLSNGKVLVAGGDTTDTAELYDPLTNKWTTAGKLIERRWRHSAFLLSNEKLLVVAGCSKTSISIPKITELYDLSTNSWTKAGDYKNARCQSTTVKLSDGNILIIGGLISTTTYSADSDLYNPLTHNWTKTGNLNNARSEHTASLLSDGKVLVTGGITTNGPIVSTEIYDPSTNSWNTTGNLYYARYQHTATVLTDGRVLITGGMDSKGKSLQSTEIYNPSTKQWTLANNLNNARTGHTASLLLDGRVLITGGKDGSKTLNTVEIY